jgi:hypothetical protein
MKGLPRAGIVIINKNDYQLHVDSFYHGHQENDDRGAP